MARAAKAVAPPASPDVMLDLETLGTSADSVIMSIGACRFDPTTNVVDDACFYASISIDSNLDAGRKPSESTILWWMGQPADARNVFQEAKTTLEEALVTFSEWFGNTKNVWANGTDFDIAMLAHAFAYFKMDTPWKFFNVNDYRTLKKLAIAKRAIVPPRSGVAHNALSDCVFQARHLQSIMQLLLKA